MDNHSTKKEIFHDDIFLTNDLSSFFLTKNKNKKKYISSLEIINGTIKSIVNNNIDSLNIFTVTSISQSFSLFLNQLNKKCRIFVTHDGTLNGILFSKAFASTLITNEIEVYFNNENKALNNSLSIFVANNSNLEFDYIVNFSEQRKKNFYHISFFNNLGFLISDEESKMINDLISTTNFLNIKVPKCEVPTINDSNIIEKYENILKSKKDLSNVKLHITNTFRMDNNLFLKLSELNNLNMNIFEFKKNSPNKLNSITKKSVMETLFKKNDLIINFTNNVNEFEILIKHKKRWKFLSFNDLSIIYLYYKYKYDNQDLKNKIVLNSIFSSKYINTLSKKFNIFNDNYYSLNKDVNAKKSLNEYLLITNGYDYFLTDENKNFCFDPLLTIKIIIELVSFFKKNFSKDLYQTLNSIYKEYGIFRYNAIKQKIDLNIASIFINRLKNLKELNNKKIIKFKENKELASCFEIVLDDGTFLTIKYFKSNNSLIFAYSSWWNEKTNLNKNKKYKETDENKFIDLIINEKHIFEKLNSLKESFDVKKATLLGIIKYSIFIILFIILCYIMFKFIFNADLNTWKQIRLFLNANPYISYLIPVFISMSLINIFITCFASKRILKKINNEKIKIHHLFVANFIAICISTITPLIFGGETVGYWYLRRKGIEKSSIASMFLVQALLAQINILLFSFVFTPIGFVRFYDLILKNELGVLLIVLIILGSIVDIFSAVMISILIFSFRFQNFISKHLNNFLEWIPFIIIRNSIDREANFKYNFRNINLSSKKIFTGDLWYKNSLAFIELLFYKVFSMLLNYGFLFAYFSNILKNDNFFISYIEIYSANSLVRNINALNFIIPGSLGLSDWAYKTISASLYKDPVFDISGSLEAYRNVSVFQILMRIMYTFTFTLLSAFALLTVFIGESRIEKYNKIKNTLTNKEIEQGKIKIKSRFYSISIIPWIFGILSFIGSWYLIYIYVLN